MSDIGGDGQKGCVREGRIKTMPSYAPEIVTECDNYEGRDDNDGNDDKDDEKFNMILNVRRTWKKNPSAR